MAKASTSAQHYLECDNCEENPAKFFCKVCAGHLCEPCKMKHKQTKITRNHVILPLTSENEAILDLLLCPDHAEKKLECYCDRCKKPVCTECIIKFHNGHSMKSLSTVYKEFKDHSKQKKEKIENDLLPRHVALLAKENDKRSAFKEKVDKIQTKIDAHVKIVIEQVRDIGKETVVSLRSAEIDGLKQMDKFKECLEEKINKLQVLSKQIDTDLEARPHSSMFESFYRDDLINFQTLPSPVEYTLTDFQPQQIKIKNMFGKPPVLNVGCIYRKNSFVSYIKVRKKHHISFYITGLNCRRRVFSSN